MAEPCLEIIAINGRASIQDLGRTYSQHLGVSGSGAADEYAFLYANKLLGNKYYKVSNGSTEIQQACAALEITLGQISFKAHANCIIAISGADCQAQINHKAIENWQSYKLSANDILTFSMPKSGLHSYLAIKGGVKLHPQQQQWLGSYSQTINELALAYCGAPLSSGSKIYFSSAQIKADDFEQTKHDSNKLEQFYAKQTLTLRFIASNVFLNMTKQKQQEFCSCKYSIAASSNRMGYRLVPKVKHLAVAEKILTDELRQQCLLSQPVNYGTIQLPANEEPIVLMKERQTMGGYPVLGTVIQTDLFRLSQMRPGQSVNFVTINYQQAQQQLQAFFEKF